MTRKQWNNQKYRKKHYEKHKPEIRETQKIYRDDHGRLGVLAERGVSSFKMNGVTFYGPSR